MAGRDRRPDSGLGCVWLPVRTVMVKDGGPSGRNNRTTQPLKPSQPCWAALRCWARCFPAMQRPHLTSSAQPDANPTQPRPAKAAEAPRIYSNDQDSISRWDLVGAWRLRRTPTGVLIGSDAEPTAAKPRSLRACMKSPTPCSLPRSSSMGRASNSGSTRSIMFSIATCRCCLRASRKQVRQTTTRYR